MVLKYKGLTKGRLRDGMLVSVPTEWDTSCLGNVEEAAWSEIAEALQRRGLDFSAKDWDFIFSSHGGNMIMADGPFLTFWEKA